MEFYQGKKRHKGIFDILGNMLIHSDRWLPYQEVTAPGQGIVLHITPRELSQIVIFMLWFLYGLNKQNTKC